MAKNVQGLESFEGMKAINAAKKAEKDGHEVRIFEEDGKGLYIVPEGTDRSFNTNRLNFVINDNVKVTRAFWG